MADIGTRMHVDGLSEYKSAMTQAQQSVKTLDAELKKNEAAYKASGDKEKYMADQAKTLEQKIKAQKDAVKQAESALKAMKDQGVDPASTSYQKMQQALLQAQAGVLETTSALNTLNQSEQTAAAGADQLTASVNGINKKVSLDQVIGGIDKITSGLENAAKKAAEVGQAIWDEIMDKAQWADDTATAAKVLGMDVEDYQKYSNIFATWADITVADWQKAKIKIEKAMYAPTSEQANVFELLGISPTEQVGNGKYGAVEVARDWESVFWEVSRALQERVKNKSMTSEEADVYAYALFGKSFANLAPLIDMGEEAFKEAFENNDGIVSEEGVTNLATLNDTVLGLKQQFEALEAEVLSGLAPSLTQASEALSGLLSRLLEYVKSEDGQKMIADLGTAVSGLFTDLGKIEPDKVIEGFVGVFNGIKETLEWLVNNKGTVEGLLIGIAGAWGAAKLTGGALQILNLINGIKGLSGASAVSAAASAGTSIGTSWGTAFSAAVLKAAPWMAFLGILFKNAITPQGNDDIFTKEEEKLANQGIYTPEMKEKMQPAPVENGVFINEKPRAYVNGRRVRNITGTGEIGEVGELVADLELDPDVEELKKEVEKIELTVEVIPKVNWGHALGIGGGAVGVNNITVMEHANALPFVPWDGYPAILHKGERVLSARENKSYTYNSNTYFGNVNLNNGLEIDALSESIARQNKKQRAGYGY